MLCFGEMIICDKTCGEEATSGGAARTLGGGSSGGRARAGAARTGSQARGAFCQPDVARAATSRARGRTAAAARGARPAAGDERVGAPSVPHDAVERGWPLGTIGHVAARLGRIETPRPAEHRGHHGASASRRPPVLLPPPLRSEHGGRGRTRRSPCDPRGCGPRAGRRRLDAGAAGTDHVDGGRPRSKRGTASAGGRRPRRFEEDRLGAARV